jgi:histidinol-phosphate aminotransferase
MTTPALEAALASLDSPDELARRRSENARGLAELDGIPACARARPGGPASANFLFAEVGEDSRPLFEQLLREGVIVRPTHGSARLRGPVTVGTHKDHEVLAEALGRVLAPA